MRKTLYLTLFLLFATAMGSGLWSQTTVTTDVQSNTTWTILQSPFLIANPIEVDSGVILTIDPGVTVRFAPMAGLEVKGILNASGSAADSIFFISDNGNTDWMGLLLNPTPGSQIILDYAEVNQALVAIDGNGLTAGNRLQLDRTAFRSNNTALSQWNYQSGSISGCLFESNDKALLNADLYLVASVFNRNEIGIESSEVHLLDCSFNKHGLRAISGSSGSVKNSSFFYNTIAVYEFGSTLLDSLTDCRFALNDTAIVLGAPQPHYAANEICGNQVQVRVSASLDLNFANNCWCSFDSAAIQATFIDGTTQAGLGTVQFMPVDSCTSLGLVWPGDTDNDGKADISDLLSIGLAYGSQGESRPNATGIWAPQTGFPWGTTFSNGTDYVHADCNGNGIVDLADTLAILTNFGQTHQKTAQAADSNGVPLCLVYPDSAAPGDTFQVQIFLGDSANPVPNAYGIAIVLGYDRDIIDSTLITADPTGTWLGDPSQNLLYLAHSDLSYHWALVRNDQIDTMGYGKMGGVEMVMIDDLGKTSGIQITVEDILLIDAQGNSIPVSLDGCAEKTSPRLAGLNSHPNPASGLVTLDLGGRVAEEIALYGSDGQLRQLQTEAASGQVELDLSDLSPGLYVVRVKVKSGVLTRKILVTK